MLDGDYSFVATSMVPGLRCAGTEEFAGLDAPPHPTRAKRFLRLGKDLLPGLDTAKPSEWMGHRPSFPDNLPAIGALAGHSNLWLGFGHGHLGLTGGAKMRRPVARDALLSYDDVELSETEVLKLRRELEQKE